MYTIQNIPYWQDQFYRMGVSQINPAWLNNINSRLETRLSPSNETIIFAVPIYPKNRGCDSSSLPKALLIRNVEIGNFSKGFSYAAQYGGLAVMDEVDTYFEDGFFVATDRRFIVVSTNNIVEYPYIYILEVSMTEDKSIFHTALVEFDGNKILRGQFCFPSAGLLVGIAAMQASEEGRATTSQRTVATHNTEARQGGNIIGGFLNAAIDVANRYVDDNS